MDIFLKILIPYDVILEPLVIFDTLFKLAAAVGLSGFIGWERGRSGQPAGLRTHIILCLGSTLLTIISFRIVEDMGTGDPTRVVAQIVSGIGFLGAGAIMRFGTNVRGLTTAATLWTITGVGMAIGAGYFLPAVVTCILVYVVLHWFDVLEARLQAPISKQLLLLGEARDDLVSDVEDELKKRGCDLRTLEASQANGGKMIRLKGRLKMRAGEKQAIVVGALMRVPGVTECELI